MEVASYLPAGLRIVAGFATLFWPLAALVVLRRGGYRVPLISMRVSRAGTWVLVGLLSLGVLMNLASSSDWERFLQAPLRPGAMTASRTRVRNQRRTTTDVGGL